MRGPSTMARAAAAVLVSLCVLTACGARAAQASGAFEVQILGMQNSRGQLADGKCCGGSSESDGTCARDCSTFFRVCLKEYQEEVSTKGPCTFGNTSSTVLGSNSFTLADPDRHSARLVVPFTFRWTGLKLSES
uniref:Notch ligand N-terminal domain-containing protein n=1 Tax=Strigamia maritima TaxID=126957 RepID=T1JH01_STRMM